MLLLLPLTLDSWLPWFKGPNFLFTLNRSPVGVLSKVSYVSDRDTPMSSRIVALGYLWTSLSVSTDDTASANNAIKDMIVFAQFPVGNLLITFDFTELGRLWTPSEFSNAQGSLELLWVVCCIRTLHLLLSILLWQEMVLLPLLLLAFETFILSFLGIVAGFSALFINLVATCFFEGVLSCRTEWNLVSCLTWN